MGRGRMLRGKYFATCGPSTGTIPQRCSPFDSAQGTLSLSPFDLAQGDLKLVERSKGRKVEGADGLSTSRRAERGRQ